MKEIPFHLPTSPATALSERRIAPFLSPLDDTLDDELIASLLSYTVLLQCDPGETIIAEGDDSNFFCILLKGAVDIVKESETITTIEGDGDVVGELALMQSCSRSASVVAATQVFCLRVKPDFLMDHSESTIHQFYALVYRFFADELGRQLDEANRSKVQ